ncbi:cysteine-rich receptor-like protein kinase 26 [Tanacetum coccineum]
MFMLVKYAILVWFSFIFSNLTTTTLAQPDFYRYLCGHPDNRSNYTENSTFKLNLDNTLSNLLTTNNGFGFYNLSTGQGNDRVNSLALCRGDINPHLCQICLNNSMVEARKVCPNNIYVVLFYDSCLLAYTNDTLLGNTKIRDFAWGTNPQNTTNAAQFNDALRLLMNKLKAVAAAGGPLRKFASGNTTGPDFTTIYALLQCTPDLSKEECNNCLDTIFMEIPKRFNGHVGARYVAVMCNFRYDVTKFFTESIALVNPPPSSSLPSPSSQQGIYGWYISSINIIVDSYERLTCSLFVN